MGLQVFLPNGLLAEGVPTFVTFVRSLIGVDVEVIGVDGFVAEA